MARKPGRWPGRPNQDQIELQAIRLVSDFKKKLEEAGLSVPPIPPVPAEYLALTLTDLTVRGVKELTVDGKHLSGLLDPAREEICYEENEVPGRQTFSIAHELGHYYLHYLPALHLAGQPTLFSDEDFADEVEMPGYFREGEPEAKKPEVRYYRCTEREIGAPEETETSAKLDKKALSDPAEQARLVKIIRQKELADRLEWEANIFARGLLMPSDLVRWLNQKHAGDVKAMAEELAVTQTALRYRLNGMGLRQDENMGLPLKKGQSKKKSHDQGSFF
jgi:Zn-dependent peptidase ImmA (M78 family)